MIYFGAWARIWLFFIFFINIWRCRGNLAFFLLKIRVLSIFLKKNAKNFKILYLHEFLRYKKDSILKRHLFGSPEPNLATLSVFRQHQALQAPLSVFWGKNDKNIIWASKCSHFATISEKKFFFIFLAHTRRFRCILSFSPRKFQKLATKISKSACQALQALVRQNFFSYLKSPRWEDIISYPKC